MKYSHKLSDAVHILSYIDIYQNNDLSSKAIATSVESNPSVIRQLMSDLRNAGLIETHKGSAKPSLAKNSSKISLLDIYQAINMDHRILHVDPKTNPHCIVGGNIQNVLDHIYSEIELQAFTKMSKVSLQDIIDEIMEQSQKNR